MNAIRNLQGAIQMICNMLERDGSPARDTVLEEAASLVGSYADRRLTLEGAQLALRTMKAQQLNQGEQGSVVINSVTYPVPFEVQELIDQLNQQSDPKRLQLAEEALVKNGFTRVDAIWVPQQKAVWINASGKAYGMVSDEQLEAVLRNAIADIHKRNGWKEAEQDWLTDGEIDGIYEQQYATYDQVCDTEDFRMFARTAIATYVAKKWTAPVASTHKSHLQGEGPWCKEVLLYSVDNTGDFPENRVLLYTHPLILPNSEGTGV